MEKKIRVLQTGNTSWEETREIPGNVIWTFTDTEKNVAFQNMEEQLFDVVILEGELSDEMIKSLRELGAAYTFFYTDQLTVSEPVRTVLADKRAKKLETAEIPAFLLTLPLKYYRGQEGDKLGVRQMEVIAPFDQSVEYDGNRALIINADFGARYRQAVLAKYNIPLNFSGKRGIELWPEYKLEGDISIQYKVRLFRRGSRGDLIWSRAMEGEELEEPLLILDEEAGYLSVQILLRGFGRAEIGPVHFRGSRIDAGQFLAGGRRQAASDRGELISYFDPGDRKPPLIVYFSGYRTAEGFEGYNMMKKLGMPFLLLGDPRLEGGAFYLGSTEYESRLADVIQSTLDELSFNRDQVIFSGLSMGTFGAVYYGSIFEPHAIVLGKPLVNLGNMAENEKRIRPGGFPTSLDVLRMVTGGNEQLHVREMNGRLWKRFDAADFKKTEFAIAYMYQDDYDRDGYADILRHLEKKNVTVVGKGLEGRHNDNTRGIVVWFLSQLRRFLRQDYDREVIKDG